MLGLDELKVPFRWVSSSARIVTLKISMATSMLMYELHTVMLHTVRGLFLALPSMFALNARLVHLTW